MMDDVGGMDHGGVGEYIGGMDRAFLMVTSAAGRKKVVLGDEPLTIGRHPENRLVVVEAQASRFHCVIETTAKGLVVKDLDSRNGTKVNGQAVKTVFLKRGDVIRIGATELRLVVPGQRVAGKVEEPVEVKEAEGLEVLEEVVLEEVELEEVERVRAEEDEAAERVNEIMSRPLNDAEWGQVDLGISSSSEDDEKFLPVLAELLPDKPFEYGEIALVNCRGQVVHEAESEEHRKQRRVAGSGEAVSVLRYIILICTRARATDVHVEPKNDDYQLRLRIDGNMVDIVRMSKEIGVRVCALVKILCDIDVQFKHIVQEGHFTAHVPGRRIDFRVSFAPAMFGQKLVIRVLDATTAPIHTKDLRLPGWMLAEVRRGMELDQGMILVCGPTGSGKTTTLYALLRDCGVERRNVVSIEDPVEIEIEGVTQVPVKEGKGNTFPALLKSMLRQDPDVMMIGEIRDGETARIAMQAAMTGHLVFSTLHTKDSIGTVFRLLDLGVEPFLVGSSLHVVVSQRLARELCPYCKRGMKPTAEQVRKMGKAGVGVKEIYMPGGCPRCLKTGYMGRRAFFEMLVTTDAMREVVMKHATPKLIEEAMKGTRFVKLVESGYQLVAGGLTAFDEIEKAVGR
ncbi:MAG: ATPase, T2SS/T4P/T4SS family [Planctomycetota bacterium]|nr:ATPase, T2SS/T4P/T4SS family [Planctomycetota bacterium]